MKQLIADSLSRLLGANALPRYPPHLPGPSPGSFCLASRFDFQTGDETHATPITARFTG